MTSARTFAAAAWRRPGVEAICLALQDVHGQCPALLLWRCWTLEAGRVVAAKTVAEAVEIARGWDGEVLRPLRAVRRRLASSPAFSPDVASPTVRRRVLEAEIEAEHALLDSLEALGTSGAAGGGSARLPAMLELADAWRPPAPTEPLARLAAAVWPAL